MAERIHLDIDATQAAQNMANLTRQVDQFALALGRVDQSAHRIFASLAELSERQRGQGFLGLDDQRQLQRGLQQWDRASQILENRRRGAEGRLQYAEARSAGTPSDLARIGQATGALRQLQRRQGAMGTLEGSIANLMQGPVPASPLQAAQMAAGGPVTPWAAGRVGLWPGGAPVNVAATRPVSQAQLNAQAAAAMGFGPGGGAATGGVSQAQLTAQAAGLIGNIGTPPMPAPRPPTPTPTQGPGILTDILHSVIGGGGLKALGGNVGGALGGLPGALIGGAIGGLASTALSKIGPIQEISLLKVGDMLNQKFDHLRGTMIGLRREFQVLNEEGREAMEGLAFATGMNEGALRRQLTRTVAAGRYYGLSAPESVGITNALMMGGARDPDLTAVMAIGREAAARHPGTMSVPRFGTQVQQAAMVGGLGMAPMSETMAARQVQFMQEMGGRYATNPAAAFAERGPEMGRPQSTIGQVLQISALDRLRRTQRYVTLGKDTTQEMQLDLNDPQDMKIAAEQIANIPEARDALREEIVRHGGGSQSTERLLYGHTTGISRNALQERIEWTGIQANTREFGSATEFFTRPADIAGEKARQAQRKAGEVTEPGFIQLENQRLQQEWAETAPIRAITAASNAIGTSLGSMAESFNKGMPLAEAFANTMEKLTPIMETFLKAMQVQPTIQGTTGGFWGMGPSPDTPLKQMMDWLTTNWAHSLEPLAATATGNLGPRKTGP